MIEVENLSKRYGTKLAVDGLNFVVQPGIVTGFLGPNGSGKSTTMRMIAGLDQPTAGRVTVNGGDYRSAAAPMAELGVLLEAKAVHTGRSARNHLLALAQTNGIKARRVDEVIDIVGLREVAGKRVGGFSLGMGQRLGRGIGAAGQPADRGPGRTGQRPGPGRGPVDAHHAQGPRRGRPHRVRVLPPDERNGPNRNTSGRHRPRPADRRHHRRRIRRPRLAPFRHRPHPGSRPTAGPAARPGHHRHHRQQPDVLGVDGLTAEHIGTIAWQNQIPIFELTVQQASLEEAFMTLTNDSVEYRSTEITDTDTRSPTPRR